MLRLRKAVEEALQGEANQDLLELHFLGFGDVEQPRPD